MEGAAGSDGAALPERHPWSAAVSAGDDVAGAPDAELVRSVGSRDGRGAVNKQKPD